MSIPRLPVADRNKLLQACLLTTSMRDKRSRDKPRSCDETSCEAAMFHRRSFLVPKLHSRTERHALQIIFVAIFKRAKLTMQKHKGRSQIKGIFRND